MEFKKIYRVLKDNGYRVMTRYRKETCRFFIINQKVIAATARKAVPILEKEFPYLKVVVMPWSRFRTDWEVIRYFEKTMYI